MSLIATLITDPLGKVKTQITFWTLIHVEEWWMVKSREADKT